MKSLLISIILGSVFLLPAIHLSAQPVNKDTTITFRVSGECGMCKKRIEAAAQAKGVSSAKWNVETKILSLTYNPSKTAAEKVHEKIVAAGHDTELKKADDAAYKALPECCFYRNPGTSHLDEANHGEGQTASKPSGESPAATAVIGFVAEETKGQIKPLTGASIVWIGTTHGTTSDASGQFTIEKHPTTDKVVISYTGYHSDTLALTVDNPVQIILQPKSRLKNVTVRTAKASMSVNTASAIRSYDITSKELLKAACCNLSESFETNPSVDVTFSDAVTGSKQIQMLGLAGNYTQLTVENLPGPRGLATSLGLNSIPGTWVDGIQLIKGTGSVVNGYESIAGQINVELKKPDNSDQLYANIYTNDFGKTDLNLNLTRKLNSKWSTALLLHDAFANRKVDMNMDHFRDFPTGNLFSGINRWSYANGKGLFAQFGVKYLKDEKTGGAVTFNPATDKFSTHHYGLAINIDRKEAFAKIGYVYPGKPYKSIGLQLSGL
jgi:copper chaperone CopZ